MKKIKITTASTSKNILQCNGGNLCNEPNK